MKRVFIPVQMSIKINYDDVLEISLGKEVSICSLIQYIKEAHKLANFLKDKGVSVLMKKCLTTGEIGQVLGCDVSACDPNADLILYVGDGKFHPLWIAYKIDKPVFVVGEKIKRVNEDEVKRLRNYVKYSRVKLAEADRVGIIVSLKPGQNRLKLANELRDKLKPKKVYIFLMDNVDPDELNDFDVDIWINTACPRLIDEREKFIKPIINVGEI